MAQANSSSNSSTDSSQNTNVQRVGLPSSMGYVPARTPPRPLEGIPAGPALLDTKKQDSDEQVDSPPLSVALLSYEIDKKEPIPVQHARPIPPVTWDPLQIQHEDYRHWVELRNTHVRRYQHLELRAAKQGIETPPSVLMEMEDLEEKIAELNVQIVRYEPYRSSSAAHRIDLAPELERQILDLIAQTAGIALSEIHVIGIYKGSIVLAVEMPLAGAARLMALYHVKHPQLAREGITYIVLDRETLTLEKRQLDQLTRAVKFEISDLQGDPDKVSDRSPYATLPGTIPLRITIDTDKVKSV